MYHSSDLAEKKPRAVANNSLKESAGRAAAFQSPYQRPKAVVQHKSPIINGNHARVKQFAASSQVIQLLQAEYAFAADNFTRDMTNEHRGVYLFTVGGEQVVVKYNVPGGEEGLTRLARQAGVNAPDIRRLTATELEALAGIPAVSRGGGSGVVMEFSSGEKLEFLGSEDREGERRPANAAAFTPDLLKQIGRSYAFQLLTGSADRWPMPVNVGAATMTEGNSGNLLIDRERGALHDIDFTPGNPGEGYAESLRAFFRNMLQHENGGDLVQHVVHMISRDHNAAYTIPDEDRPHIVAGMTEVMALVDHLDVPASGLGDNYAARIQAVRNVFMEELQDHQQQAQQAAQAQAQECECCYITTACVKRMGLSDDCEELTLLRRFRDSYLLQKKNGEQLIDLYYRYSPQIVTAIRRRDDEEEILKRLYGIIRVCVEAIKQQDYEFTYQTYCKMVIGLKDEFIPECPIGIPSY
jgi:hypothetical protein